MPAVPGVPGATPPPTPARLLLFTPPIPLTNRLGHPRTALAGPSARNEMSAGSMVWTSKLRPRPAVEAAR